MPYTAEERAERNREFARRSYLDNPERHYEATKEWKRTHPEERKAIRRRHYHRHIEKRWLAQYGIGVPEYEEMLVEQDGRCAVCRARPTVRRLSIDHNHATGRVRGLLCAKCNSVIGLALDDPGVLSDAAAYIEAAE